MRAKDEFLVSVEEDRKTTRFKIRSSASPMSSACHRGNGNMDVSDDRIEGLTLDAITAWRERILGCVPMLTRPARPR